MTQPSSAAPEARPPHPSPVVVSLPIADRCTSFAFYGDGLGFEPVGEPAGDGVPEPLQFALNDGVRVMLVPVVGFGWITGDHEVAASGCSECIVTLSATSDADVDATIERARRAGATIVTPAARQPWGYTGTFADPDGHLWMIRTAEA